MDTMMVFNLAAIALGAVGLLAFLWTLRAGQYDDPEGAAARILLDDDLDPPERP